jgi:archaemetzincin
MKKILLLLPLLLLFSFTTYKPTIYLVPMGNISNRDVELSAKELNKFYSFNVVVIPRSEVPKSTKVNGLKKYNANKILEYLNSKYSKYNGKVLGLTDVDICTDRELNGKLYHNWGIFGLGLMSGKPCVVSVNRLGKNHSNDMVKVVVHEIGHTLGIPHCRTNIKCLMNDAKGKGSQVKNELLWICNDCKKKIRY